MQDEEIDIIIREAASQHHPAYDDKAWGKMGQLLDKNLPLKKERRRWILFLLLFLMLDASIFLVIVKSWKNKDAIAAENHIKYTPSSTKNKESFQTENITGNIPKQIQQNKMVSLTTAHNKQIVPGNPYSVTTEPENEFLNMQAKRKTILNNNFLN